MREAVFEVTEEWIKDNKTARGGWIAAQMSVLGEKWPPQGGWITRACGRRLTLPEKAAFEAAANSKRACRRMAKAARKQGNLARKAAELDRKLSASSGRDRKQTKRPATSGAPVIVEGVDVRSSEFLRTWAWRELRYATIKRYGAVCMCCGATPQSSGEPINVDHIKPRSLFPWLALDQSNAQILCAACNQGKSNKDFTDWRSDERDGASLDDLDAEAREHMRMISGR